MGEKMMDFNTWAESISAELDNIKDDMEKTYSGADPEGVSEALGILSAHISRLSEIFASPRGDSAQRFLAKKMGEISLTTVKHTEVVAKAKLTVEYLFSEAIDNKLKNLRQVTENLRSILSYAKTEKRNS